MPFPACEHVIYKKSPLINVVCQLRFPPILIINTSEPSAFQNRIRAEYPNYEIQIEQQQISFDPQMGQPTIPRILQTGNIRNYRFSTKDNIWQINLTSTFIAISTSKYFSWDDFKARFNEPFKALVEIYNPSFFDRIGLRYIDAFKRSELGLGEKNWSDLINPYALGFLSSDKSISSRVRMNRITSEITLSDDKSIVKTIATTGTINNDPEECFITDNDLFTLEKSGLDCGLDVWPKLNYLHDRSYRLIRWIINDTLHEAMEPTIL